MAGAPLLGDKNSPYFIPTICLLASRSLPAPDHRGARCVQATFPRALTCGLLISADGRQWQGTRNSISDFEGFSGGAAMTSVHTVLSFVQAVRSLQQPSNHGFG